MKKILAVKGLINKTKNIAKFVKVVIRSIEFFHAELENEFPTDEPLKPAENEVIS